MGRLKGSGLHSTAHVGIITVQAGNRTVLEGHWTSVLDPGPRHSRRPALPPVTARSPLAFEYQGTRELVADDFRDAGGQLELGSRVEHRQEPLRYHVVQLRFQLSQMLGRDGGRDDGEMV